MRTFTNADAGFAGVDELDLRILRELGWRPADPVHAARGIQRPWDIARRLGVHGNTVKTRLDALAEARVLKGIHCAPHPSLVGLHTGVYRFLFDSVAAKRAGLAKLVELGLIADTHDFVGTEAWVAFGASVHEPLDERVRTLVAVAGAREARFFYSRARYRHELDRLLTPLDCRILLALLDDGVRPLSEVADATGVTLKTVRARFRALVDARAIALIPHVNIGALTGLVPYVLVFHFRDPKDAPGHSRIYDAFPEAVLRSVPQAENGYLMLATRSFKEAEDTLLRAQAAAAPSEVRLLLPTETIGDTAWIRRPLEARLAEAPSPLPES